MRELTNNRFRVNHQVVDQLRTKHGLTQVTLGKRARLGQSTLSRLLSPHHHRYTGIASIKTIQQLAQALDVPPAKIILPDNAPLPKPATNAKGEVVINVAGFTDRDGVVHPPYQRVLRPGVHYRPRTAKNIRRVVRAKAATKPSAVQIPSDYTGIDFIRRYEGAAKRMLVVNDDGHTVFDLSKVRVFYIG